MKTNILYSIIGFLIIIILLGIGYMIGLSMTKNTIGPIASAEPNIIENIPFEGYSKAMDEHCVYAEVI